MEFNNFVVNDISSYQMHFSLPELLEYVSSRAILLNWLSEVRSMPYLDPASAEELSAIYEMLQNLDKPTRELPEELTFQPFREDVAEGCMQKYLRVCWILDRLMKLAEYSPDAQDCGMIRKSFVAQGLLKDSFLHVETDGSGASQLFNASDRICILPKGNRKFITMASNPYSGILGICRDGTVVNGSAFHIPSRENYRAVKVQLSLTCYAVLYEDGLCVHNVPMEDQIHRARNVDLKRDCLSWDPL